MKLPIEEIINIEKTNEVALYPKRGIALARGEGIYIYDTAGKRYIDCMTNIGVNILGYGNKDITQAIAKQIEILPSCHQTFYSEQRASLIQEFTSILPHALSKFIFANTGAESVEIAIKLAKAATGRKKFIATKNSYHGRTLGALSATGREQYRTPFLPLLPEFIHVPFNDYKSIEKAADENTAAIIMEPIQGEGGAILPDNDYLKKLKDLCEKRKIKLIVDEVQTAIRTGTWLASVQYGCIPDIVCLSKSFSYGIPFGLVATTKIISDTWPKGGQSTFAGNPVACTAALKVIQYIKKGNYIVNAKTVGEYLLQKLKSIKKPVIKEVRGRGLMIGMELTGKVTPYVKKMQDNGLLTIPSANNTIRFLPPITLTQKDVDEIFLIVKDVFE